MRILVTGGLGFVGSELLPLLYKHDIIVLDNLLSNPNISTILKGLSNITLVEGDIRDSRLVCHLMNDVDTIVHLAGIVGFPACDIDTDFSYSVNVIGTDTLLAHVHKDQHFIFMSSTSSYGDKNNLPIITEDTPLEPLTSYGEHKKLGELLVSDLSSNFTIFRPATSFGVSKQIRVDLLPNTLAYNALTNGIIDIYEPESMRTFIHVHDFARAIQHVIENNICGIYNIGNPELTVSKGALAITIGELAQVPVMLRTDASDPDKRNYVISFDKFENTGFKCYDKFDLGFRQIKDNLEKIQADFGRYTTPEHVRRFLKRDN